MRGQYRIGLRGACGALLALALMGAFQAVGKSVDKTAAMHHLKLNEVRMLGSHNSYRPAPTVDSQTRIQALAPALFATLLYGHSTFEQQLALGLRQFELDVVTDPLGGFFAGPYATSDRATRRTMARPGAKVLHIPLIDYPSHCLTFRTCLLIFANWSNAHPDHAPIVILVNSSDFPQRPPQWTNNAVFDSSAIDALNTDIFAVIGRRRTVTPDDVRGRQATLRDAVIAKAWPTVNELKGKFIFVLDGSLAHEAMLRDRHPSLAGRAMFGWYDEAAPEAAMFNIQNPVSEGDRIRRLVSAGFIVRTRSDANTVEARTHNKTRMVAALASGAQIISTDYYPGAPDPGGFYFAQDFGGAYVRCNEFTAKCAQRRKK